MKTINNISPININGEDYWTISQFSELTQKTEGSIRMLMSRGNKKRKLTVVHIHNKPYIPYNELFEFPFVEKGRPNELGIYISKNFCLDENGILICKDLTQYPKDNEFDEDEEDPDDFEVDPNFKFESKKPIEESIEDEIDREIEEEFNKDIESEEELNSTDE